MENNNGFLLYSQIQIQHLLKLNTQFPSLPPKSMYNSNTTLVKVKLSLIKQYDELCRYSNTTLVKVKYKYDVLKSVTPSFKYNTC